MNEEKREIDLLDIWKERIKTGLKNGDRKKACSVAGATATTFSNALKKNRFADLSDMEARVLESTIEIIEERQKRYKILKEKYAC